MNIFIDPPYKIYYQDQLFNASNDVLNRDDTLAPYIRMRNSLAEKNVSVKTADYLYNDSDSQISGDYYSFGLLDKVDFLLQRKNIKLKAFVIFEPPVVAPELYCELPKLTRLFDVVYLHNTEGDGYSLKGVDKSKLKKFHWPQPHCHVLEQYWNKTERLSRIVVINGNHKPKSYVGELYSKRINVIAELVKLDIVDLYGRGWANWWSRASMWFPYWLHRKALMSVYKGPCDSKHAVLSQYLFSLCFENMEMQGYITEKIFDCLYAGTIPIYLGAKDITNLIPADAFIDFRHYGSMSELRNYLMSLSKMDIDNYKRAGLHFLEGKGLSYYNSINDIIQANSRNHAHG